MPADLFDRGNNVHFNAVLNAMYKADAKAGRTDADLRLMAKSWCNEWDVTRVPLKPDPGVFEDDTLDRSWPSHGTV